MSIDVDPQTNDVGIDAGDQESLTFTFTNTDGSPWDGTGATLEFIVKSTPDDPLSSARLKITTVLNPAQWNLSQIALGIAGMEFLPENTSGLAGDRYYYGVKATGTDLKPHTPISAFFEVRKNPTAA